MSFTPDSKQYSFKLYPRSHLFLVGVNMSNTYIERKCLVVSMLCFNFDVYIALDDDLTPVNNVTDLTTLKIVLNFRPMETLWA